jgi:hypothetical protein
MNINPNTLPSVAFIEKETLPDCCGIYFVMNGDEILYIGKSVRICNRWKAHHKLEMIKSLENSDNFRIAWLELKDRTLLDETEIALITHFKPKLNGAVFRSINKAQPDKSETVRIKSSFADFIREESLRLNLNFLDTLYYIINVYRYEISQKSVLRTVNAIQEQPATIIPPTHAVESKNTPESTKVTDTSTSDDDEDFYANCK